MKKSIFYGFQCKFQNSLTLNIFFFDQVCFIIDVAVGVIVLVIRVTRLVDGTLTLTWEIWNVLSHEITWIEVIKLTQKSSLRFLFCCFPDNSPESDRRDLLRELHTMKQLKPHPHVIKLLGCVTETGKLFKSNSPGKQGAQGETLHTDKRSTQKWEFVYF